MFVRYEKLGKPHRYIPNIKMKQMKILILKHIIFKE